MRLVKRPDGTCWYVHLRDRDGRRIKRATGCTDRAAAEALGRQWERELADPDTAAIRAETLSVCLTRFVESTRNERTRSFYAQKAGHLLGLLGAETLVADLRPHHVDTYVRTRRTHYAVEPTERRAGRLVTEHTIHKELATLRAALNASARLGLYKGDVRALIPRHSAEYEPRSHWLTELEVRRLVESFHVSQADHAARVAFAVAVGAEWAALDRAKREDIGPDYVRVRGTKSAKRDRIVPIVTEWQRALLEFVCTHAAGDALLFRPWSWRGALLSLERAAARSGIAHTTWHDLRRTFAQLLRRGGVHNEDLAPVLGHANERVTESVYSRLDAPALRDRLLASLGTPAGQTGRTETDFADTVDAGRFRNPSKSSGETVGRPGLEPGANGLKVRWLPLVLRRKTRGETRSQGHDGTPAGQRRQRTP